MINSTSTSDQDMLTELRILGSIRENDRISTNNAIKPQVRIQKPAIMRGLNRLFHSESRSNNIMFIQSLFQVVIEKYNAAVLRKNVVLSDRIKAEIYNAIEGIDRLKRTYEDDLQFQACINISIETVRIHLGIKDRVELQEEHPAEPPDEYLERIKPVQEEDSIVSS
jgi:hypothetical protein